MRLVVVITIGLVWAKSLNAQLVQKCFVGSTDKIYTCFTPTPDGGYAFILGKDTSTMFSSYRVLVKTDSNFNTEWSKQINSGGYAMSSVNFTTLNDGGYMLMDDASTITRFDTAGNCLWARNLGPSAFAGYEVYSKFVEKPNGKIVIMKSAYNGISIYQFSSLGVCEWAKFVNKDSLDFGKNPGFDIIAFEDSSIVVSGKTNSDNCFVRFDDAGNVMWSTVFRVSDSYNNPKAMIQTNDGNILVAGLRAYWDTDGMIMKISGSDGTLIWQKETQGFYFTDIEKIGLNNYVAIGRNAYYLDHLSIITFDGNGEFLVAKKQDGIADNSARLTCINEKTFLSTSTSIFGVLSILELDSLLNFDCNSEDFEFTESEVVGVPIYLGELDVTNIPLFTTPTYTISVVDIASIVQPVDFCIGIYTEESEEPEEPVGTSGNNIEMNQNDLDMPFFTTVGEQEVKDKINLFPNPANSFVNVKVPFAGQYSVRLTDMMGKEVLLQNFNGGNSTLMLESCAKGVYMMQIVELNTSATHSQKLVIE